MEWGGGGGGGRARRRRGVLGSDVLRVKRNRGLEDDAAHGQRHVQHVVHDEGVEAECEAVHLPFDNLQRAVPRRALWSVQSCSPLVLNPLESHPANESPNEPTRLAESCSLQLRRRSVRPLWPYECAQP